MICHNEKCKSYRARTDNHCNQYIDTYNCKEFHIFIATKALTRELTTLREALRLACEEPAQQNKCHIPVGYKLRRWGVLDCDAGKNKDECLQCWQAHFIAQAKGVE